MTDEKMKLEPQHIDYQELKRSTEVHIRGIKLQLLVAQATLVIATVKEMETRPKEEEPTEKEKEKLTDQGYENYKSTFKDEEKCESTKTDTKD